MDTTVSVRVDEDVKRAAEQAAARAGVSVSEMVRMLLEAVAEGRISVSGARLNAPPKR